MNQDALSSLSSVEFCCDESQNAGGPFASGNEFQNAAGPFADGNDSQNAAGPLGNPATASDEENPPSILDYNAPSVSNLSQFEREVFKKIQENGFDVNSAVKSPGFSIDANLVNQKTSESQKIVEKYFIQSLYMTFISKQSKEHSSKKELINTLLENQNNSSNESIETFKKDIKNYVSNFETKVNKTISNTFQLILNKLNTLSNGNQHSNLPNTSFEYLEGAAPSTVQQQQQQQVRV